MPHRVDRRWIPVAGRSSKHRGAYEELEQILIGPRSLRVQRRPLCGELVSETTAKVGRLEESGPTDDVERVLVGL